MTVTPADAQKARLRAADWANRQIPEADRAAALADVLDALGLTTPSQPKTPRRVSAAEQRVRRHLAELGIPIDPEDR
jgi:hypothetical protein